MPETPSDARPSGRPCIEPGCPNEAGTPWTDHWCLPHDEERRARITRRLEDLTRSLEDPTHA